MIKCVKISCKFDQLIDPNKIKPHPKNPSEHPSLQLTGLEITLKENEIRHPLIISKNSGYLVAGHARLAVMKNLGMEKVPVVYQDFDNEQKEFQFMVSDNESQRMSWLNPQRLEEGVKKLKIEKINYQALGIYDSIIPLERPSNDQDNTTTGVGTENASQGDSGDPGDPGAAGIPIEKGTPDNSRNSEQIIVKLFFDDKQEHEAFIKKCMDMQQKLNASDIKDTLSSCLDIAGNWTH